MAIDNSKIQTYFYRHANEMIQMQNNSKHTVIHDKIPENTIEYAYMWTKQAMLKRGRKVGPLPQRGRRGGLLVLPTPRPTDLRP